MGERIMDRGKFMSSTGILSHKDLRMGAWNPRNGGNESGFHGQAWMDDPNRQRNVMGDNLLNPNQKKKEKAMLPTKAVEIIKKAAWIYIGSGEDRVFWRDHWVACTCLFGFFIKVICFESG